MGALLSANLMPLVAGVALAAVAGLRAFLPLFAIGLAGRLDWVPLGETFRWLDSTPALVAFGTASVVEILGDKIPAVDHALDVLGVVVKPIAGSISVYAMVSRLDPMWAAILSILVGGSLAGAVHVGKAKTRLGSTALTLGAGNPALSVAEDAVSVGGIALAFLWPVVALVLLLLAAGLAWLVFRTGRRLVQGRRVANTA